MTRPPRSNAVSVLRAAAMTYVAATVTAVLHLLYYVMLLSGMSRE